MSRAELVGAVDGYESNVFVNCPFDAKYLALLRPLLFTIAYLGYRPRIAAERSDSYDALFAVPGNREFLRELLGGVRSRAA